MEGWGGSITGGDFLEIYSSPLLLLHKAIYNTLGLTDQMLMMLTRANANWHKFLKFNLGKQQKLQGDGLWILKTAVASLDGKRINQVGRLLGF